MSEKIKLSQLVARPLNSSEPLLTLDVTMPDQSNINLLSQTLTGLSPSTQATVISEILEDGLESRKVMRLRCALVLVDDSGVQPLRLKWYSETYPCLSNLPYAGDAIIWRSGDPEIEPGAYLAIEKCTPVVGQFQYLAAFGNEGDPDEDDWAVAAVEEVEMLKLRDSTYVSVAEFHADPLAYVLAIT